jgi:glycosyltransferase involved in cell wall biosynthesis
MASWGISPASCIVARSIFFYTDSRELGGAENALLMLLENLASERWRPTLLLNDAASADRLAALGAGLGVPVARVPEMPLGLGGARRAPALARLLRRESPDLFHAHLSAPLSTKWGLSAAVLARVPTVATVQLVPAFEPDRAARLQLRALASGVDRYIAVSEDIARELRSRFHWPARKIEVVRNAVAVERFERPRSDALRAELSGGRELPIVLTCARLGDQKGHPVLFRAAAETPGAIFALAGDGPLRGELEGEAARLGLADRVVFLGRRTDVPDLLAACDVFALPSLYEGTSLAVLEAMAAGRAVVSSSIGGTDELIEDGVSGLLVAPGDAAALGGAIRRLLDDPELRHSVAARARERARTEFTPQEMAARVEGVYTEVLGR